MEEFKTCNKCGENKPLDAFGSGTSNGKAYTRGSCKSCIQEARKAKNKTPNNKTIREGIAMDSNIINKPEPTKYKPQFTDTEYNILKDLINNYTDLKASMSQNKAQPDIKQIISEVLSEDCEKVNKTYSMDISLIDAMKVYCKENRIYQSDLINIAVKDFMKRNTKI